MYIIASKQPAVTRERLLKGPQDNRACAYKTIIQYVILNQTLDAARYMDSADELETHAHKELDYALAVSRQADMLRGS